MIADGWGRLPEMSGAMNVAFKRGETTALAPHSLLAYYNQGLMALPGDAKKIALVYVVVSRNSKSTTPPRHSETGHSYWPQGPTSIRRHAGRVAAVCPIRRRVRVT